MSKKLTILTTIALFLAFSCGQAFGLITKTESFDSQAAASANGWGTGSVNPSTMGWCSTNNAGGAAAGEAGGAWDGVAGSGVGGEQRYYADTTLGDWLTDADTFSASGVFITTSPNWADNATVGHFNKVPQSGDVTGVGLVFEGNDNGKLMARIDGVDADTQSGWSPNGMSAVACKWNYTYDSGTRVLTAYIEQIDNPSNNTTLTTTALASDKHFSLDAFGISANLYWDWNNTSDQGEIYIDDVTYSSNVPEPATIAILGLGSLVLLRKRR